MFNYCSEPWDLCHRFCLYINSQLKYCNTFISRTLYLQAKSASNGSYFLWGWYYKNPLDVIGSLLTIA